MDIFTLCNQNVNNAHINVEHAKIKQHIVLHVKELIVIINLLCVCKKILNLIN